MALEPMEYEASNTVLTGSGLFDMISGMLDIAAEAPNGAAACADDGNECRSYHKKNQAFT
jgi:hypothetical protein